MTTTTSEDVAPLDLEACLAAQAHSTWRKYRQYVTVDDLLQEGWLWVTEHPKAVRQYMEHEEPKLAYWLLSRDLWKPMDRFARNERASFLGYSPEDEAFYARKAIQEWLPSILAGEAAPLSAATERVSKGDPAEGGTWIAVYLDVKQAWEKSPLSSRERWVVSRIYADGLTQGDLGEELGITQQSVSSTLGRAMGKMIDHLGGFRPVECPDNCECHDAPLRRRPSTQSKDAEVRAMLR